jgi:hypothetical protein
MVVVRGISSLLLLFVIMQRRACLKCYAFASKANVPARVHSNWQSSWGQLRGGSTSSSSSRLWASTSSPKAISLGSGSSPLNKIAKESLSIAGSSNTKDFGGLSYRESSPDEYRVVFVLGGPGAGKGTQSALMLENYPCVHLSAGELLRKEATKPDSPHAALIEKCLVAGNIVPVEISLSLLQNAMQEASQSQKEIVFLVDGFPR